MEEYLSFDDLKELNSNTCFRIDSDVAIEAFRRKALSGITPPEMLDYVFEALGAFIPFDRVGVALRDGEWLRSKWVKSRVPVRHLTVGYSAKIEGSSLARILNSGKPRVIGDLEAYLKEHPQSHSTHLILKDGIRSSLTFPLQLHECTFGVVFFSSRASHAYNVEHMRVLESVAQGLAVIVDQFQAHQVRREMQNQEQTLSRVSHDMRSPLAVISGFTDLLYDSPDFERLSEASKRFFSVIRKNTKFLLALVDDISDLGDLSKNPFSVQLKRVALDDFTRSTGECLSAICTQKQISLMADNKCLTDEWRFDPLRIREVLENLISNAVKFSNPGTSVNLRLWTTSNRLYFSVTDHGPGVDERDIPKLFHKFGRVGARPTAGEKSTGLGLFICKQIVEKHGGEISVRSRLGEGSVFEFWIPWTGNQ
jgi:signal transduction histidine kinase